MIETGLVITIAISSLIGFALGLLVAFIWKKASSNTTTSGLSHSEDEMKTIFVEQARHHIETNKEAIDAIHARLEQLVNNTQQFESSLQIGNESNDKTAFFGEHASVFLRNSKRSPASSLSENREAQPLDFSSKSSGVFVGNATESKTVNK